jgi:hypothetical protein
MATSIDTALSSDQIAAGDILTTTVTVHLEGIPSGEYSGELLVTSSGDVLTLPVTVRVKQPWWWAFLALLVGSVFGGLLTSYRQRIQPYDEILIRAGRLKTQMRNDPDIISIFREHIERHLVDTEVALQGTKLEQARQEMTNAEEVWQRWRRDKINWKAQFDYIQQLQRSIEKAHYPTDTCEEAHYPSDTFYMREIQRNLRDAERAAPTLEQGPTALETQLQKQKQAIERYQELYRQIESMLTKIAPYPSLQQRAAMLQMQLYNLRPDNTSGLDMLEHHIAEWRTEVVQQTAPEGESNAEVLGSARSIAPGFRAITLPPVPSLLSVSISEAQGKQSAMRLQWMLWTSSIFVLVLLTLVGFGQIYGTNVTFGANPWTDYAALLAWGFGVEASRASIVGFGASH